MRILKRSQLLHVLLIVCWLAAGSVAGSAEAAALATPASVQAALKRAAIPVDSVGIHVQEVASNQSLVSVNAEQAFNPASTMKLLTTGAALELMGPTATFSTTAYARGERDGDQLVGDLILRGSGDPKLVVENLWLFLRKIRAQGIRVIRGNLLLDRSAFAAAPASASGDPSQFDGDPLKPYNALPDALLLNFKALAVRFMPDTRRGTVSVTFDPQLDGYAVVGPRLGAEPCGADWRQNIAATLDANTARFDGTFAAACGEKFWQIHPYQLSRNRYFELIFRQLWAGLGGSFEGKVIDGEVPPSAVLLAQWDSPALPELIRDINKFSNNVMARQLFLALGSAGGNTPANVPQSRAVIARWLTSNGIDGSGLVLENGSGLSRIERISAATLGKVLVSAFRSPLMPEFIASLPLVGYDGTMKKRLRTQDVAGRAHIKSGSLQDVRTIAGYVLAESGRRYAVVFLINHANAARGAEAQDALLQWVYRDN